jgi:hypothetical protein
MQESSPAVRVVSGRLLRESGVRPVARAWLPRSGQVVAKIPALKGNHRWLHESVGIRSPRLEGDRWFLPRSCLTRLVIAAVDRYGFIAVWRDMSKLSRCTRACLEATGIDCDCWCLGVHHGQDSDGWYERVGDVVVSELGEITRVQINFGAVGTEADATVYRGELRGRSYRADRAGRRGWPKASRFACAACMSTRASVWDHCHAHGFVRAPLCNICNTRTWGGWHPQHGRVTPGRNLDTIYYRWCPRYEDEWASRPCSA